MTKDAKKLIGFTTIIFIVFIIVVATLVSDANAFFALALIMWCILFVYCLQDLNKDIVLFCYLIAFFVFLFGREVCFAYFGLDKYYRYLEPYNDITFILLTISLICLFLGYYLADKYHIRLNVPVIRTSLRTDERLLVQGVSGKSNTTKIVRFRKASMIAFYYCLVFSFIDVLFQIRRVQLYGYAGGYAAENVSTSGLAAYFSSFTLVALSLYLATCPGKRESWVALLGYEVYGMLTMLTGHRYAFVAISMYCLTYLVYRHKKETGWISKKMVILIVVALPFLIILMNVIDTVRAGSENTGNGGLVNAIVSFLDAQGGSVNVIKRIFYYKKEISDMKFTSLHNTRTVIFENAVMRKMFNIKVFSGNSLENALQGHSLAHRLSYYEYGNYYLQGHGVGSSYIAELFHDFSYPGVIIGNLVYGYAIRRITDIDSKHFFRNGLLFASQYYLFLAPRGNFDGMVGGLFSITSIMGMLGILVLSCCFKMGRIYDYSFIKTDLPDAL